MGCAEPWGSGCDRLTWCEHPAALLSALLRGHHTHCLRHGPVRFLEPLDIRHPPCVTDQLQGRDRQVSARTWRREQQGRALRGSGREGKAGPTPNEWEHKAGGRPTEPRRVRPPPLPPYQLGQTPPLPSRQPPQLLPPAAHSATLSLSQTRVCPMGVLVITVMTITAGHHIVGLGNQFSQFDIFILRTNKLGRKHRHSPCSTPAPIKS